MLRPLTIFQLSTCMLDLGQVNTLHSSARRQLAHRANLEGTRDGNEMAAVPEESHVLARPIFSHRCTHVSLCAACEPCWTHHCFGPPASRITVHAREFSSVVLALLFPPTEDISRHYHPGSRPASGPTARRAPPPSRGQQPTHRGRYLATPSRKNRSGTRNRLPCS